MKIFRGTSADNAIKIPSKIGESHKSDKLIEEEINGMFGNLNGDFFIMTEQVRTDLQGRKFKIVFVEDKDDDKHTLFFQLIPS